MSQTPYTPLKEALAMRVRDGLISEGVMTHASMAEDALQAESTLPAPRLNERPTQVLTPAVKRVLEWHLRQSVRH